MAPLLAQKWTTLRDVYFIEFPPTNRTVSYTSFYVCGASIARCSV